MACSAGLGVVTQSFREQAILLWWRAVRYNKFHITCEAPE
jgi:hypothetical protein